MNSLQLMGMHQIDTASYQGITSIKKVQEYSTMQILKNSFASSYSFACVSLYNVISENTFSTGDSSWNQPELYPRSRSVPHGRPQWGVAQC